MRATEITSTEASVPVSQDVPTAVDARTHVSHAGQAIGFWRHFFEMLVAMWIGMFVGGVAFAAILGLLGSSTAEVRTQAPELSVIVMGASMTVPMIGWMRHRGHERRASFEMAAAMFLPAVPCIVLLRTEVIAFTSMCGVYCASMTAAMLVLMLYRREEYSRHPA